MNTTLFSPSCISPKCGSQRDSTINNRMLINEITNPLPLFHATVRAKTSSATMMLKTAIYAEGDAQARQLLTAIYGEGSVLSLALSESGGTQTLTTDQLKLKSMADQKALISQNEKRERARQKLAKAQKTMQLANAAKMSSVGA